ncbi:unnamed protein product, partial [marine sediment metagenome]
MRKKIFSFTSLLLLLLPFTLIAQTTPDEFLG